MLKVRIIPTLLWKNFGLVKGVGFHSWRRVGTILPAVRVYNTRQVDELILVDVNASQESRLPDFDMVAEISSECFFPLTVGGGIHTVDQVKQLLRAGADKVSINTAAYTSPNLISDTAKLFGSQCVVVSIDVKETSPGHYECFSHAGTRPTGKDLFEWVEQVAKMGAGEILLTSIERDGTMKGYDLEMIRKVTQRVNIPVIASGGAGSYEDMFQALSTAGATAIAAASIFHYTEMTPLGAKEYLGAKGIPVRLSNTESFI